MVSRCLALALLALSLFAAPARAALVGDWRFDDSLASSAGVAGAPAIEDVGTANSYTAETVDGAPNRVRTFAAGNGFHIPDTGGFFTSRATLQQSYTVVIEFRFTDVASYRRILNMRAPATAEDRGLYVFDGKLDFYDDGGDNAEATPSFAPNQYVEVAFSRFYGADASFAVYANGAQVVAPLLESPQFANLTSEGLWLFTDDTGGLEESGGAISRVRLYEGALTNQQVTDLHNQSDPAPPDGDSDGTADYADNCPTAANADQADADADGQGNACDSNDDGDGFPDDSDNCDTVVNAGQEDLDSDGEGDPCDADDDGDGTPDTADTCPTLTNTGQADIDADGQGDACDGDDDGDGDGDTVDNCPTVSNADQADLDGDGQGNVCDNDADGDGLVGAADRCPLSAVQLDADGDGLPNPCDPDDDGDGVFDAGDPCPLTARIGLNGCPPAQLRRTGRVRTKRAGKRGIRVLTGFEAICPASPVACVVKGSVAPAKGGAAVRTLGSVKRTVQPGTRAAINIKLTKKGARALRKAGSMRVKIKVSITGADVVTAKRSRIARIKAPS